jgi:hypothetical protein
MKTSESRRWAMDMYEHYSNKSMELAIKAEAHKNKMIAEADLADAKAGIEPAIAEEAIVSQIVPIVGEIRLKGGRRIYVERPYNGEAETEGIHVAWEWRNDPTAEEQAGQLCRMYIGTVEAGPVAQWDADDGQWYELKGRGNHGKRYAFGGNWTSTKVSIVPAIVARIGEIMDKTAKIKVAEAKLEAARLRVKAAHQLDMASGYERQAANPAYAGQDMVCLGKANVVRSLAAQTLAEADLVEAKA